MQQLLDQLGIDWHLLLSQAVNFFLLLIILWYFVYKPLLKLLRDRRTRIEEGLMKADEADRRLTEIEKIGKEKLQEAEAQALGILRKTEIDAKAMEGKLLAEARRHEAEELANTQALLRAQEEESRRAAEKEAAALVRRAIVRTVELAPENINDSLIAKAVEEAGRSLKNAI